MSRVHATLAAQVCLNCYLATGKEIEGWNACIRPALDATRPYAVCFAFSSQTFLLAPTPTGQASTFAGGMGHLEGDDQIYDGRVFWIAPSQSEIDYFDLPA